VVDQQSGRPRAGVVLPKRKFSSSSHKRCDDDTMFGGPIRKKRGTNHKSEERKKANRGH